MLTVCIRSQCVYAQSVYKLTVCICSRCVYARSVYTLAGVCKQVSPSSKCVYVYTLTVLKLGALTVKQVCTRRALMPSPDSLAFKMVQSADAKS